MVFTFWKTTAVRMPVYHQTYRCLRQHNQEIKGGAKYTTSKSPSGAYMYCRGIPYKNGSDAI